MLDIDLEEELVRKVGGKFALTYLLQRRLVELNRGEKPLIELDPGEELDKRRIACQEILQGKIELAPNAQLIAEAQEEKKRIAAERIEQRNAEATAEPVGTNIKRMKEERIKELSQLLNPNKK